MILLAVFMAIALFIVACAVATTCGLAAVIVPGAAWTDTSGNVIQAHGGGFLKVGSTYYWFGEDKSENSALFKAVGFLCLFSFDQVPFVSVGQLLHGQTSIVLYIILKVNTPSSLRT